MLPSGTERMTGLTARTTLGSMDDFDEQDDVGWWLARHYDAQSDDAEFDAWPTFPVWADLVSAYVRYRLHYRLLHSISVGMPFQMAEITQCTPGDAIELRRVAKAESLPYARYHLGVSGTWYNTLALDYASREGRTLSDLHVELGDFFDSLQA
jgi:hypothetical protein